MTIIEINKRYYTIPTSWNELSGRQLVECMNVFLKDWPVEKKLLKLLKILTGMSKWGFFWGNVDEFADYFYLLNFLFSENTLTKNILPEYKSFYGPDDSLNNIIVEEYVFTESHYQQYKDSNNLLDLDNLCAVLYRPRKENYDYSKNPEGDIRIPFNDHLIGFHGSIINKWPLGVKLAILHFYEGCRAKLITDYDDVFGGSGEPAKRGILSIVVSMAEAGTFGDFEKVEKLYLQTFMIGISEAIEKDKRMEQQLKNNRTA